MALFYQHSQLASSWLRNSGAIVASCFFIGLATGCIGSVDGVDDDATPAMINTVTNTNEPSVIVGSSSAPVQAIDEVTAAPIVAVQQTPTINTDDESELARLLTTDFIIENQQIVPTTGWICADSIGQSRTYYFYRPGVLDASRSVAIERTLNPNNTYSDISFFWSIASMDAILMTSVFRDGDGLLISTGQQYDVNSIRFEEVESVQTFTAQSVLRGRLVCANYDIS